jgi:cell division protein FtsI (penicillin-binding protein 3)
MAKPAARLAFLQALLAIGGVAVVARAFVVQVVEHDAWVLRAEQRNIRARDIAARRGGIYDRDGVPLAATFEAYHVSVSVNELLDEAQTKRMLQEDLGVSKSSIEREFRNAYPYFDGPFDATQVHRLRRVRGVHLQPLLGREHPMGSLAQPLVGRVDRETGQGIEGIEAAYDTLLSGTPGIERVLIDVNGRAVPIPGTTVREPKSGHDLLLTIDHELQGIAEGALARAVEQFEARGGDVVILDVSTGEVLAIASLRTPEGRSRPVANSAALVEPNEPGSTAKIFAAAAVLAAGADTSAVSGEGGVWQMEVARGRTRTIRDVHRVDGGLTLGEAIQVSSNIAISKFALLISGEQQYTMLRNFGFGSPVGTGYPGESPGLLRLPSASDNLRYTMPSWAQGYEFTVSALQMATAYAAIANGGTLLAPSLLREVREWPSGRVVWRHKPDTVRQAVTPELASQLLDYLSRAADSGGTGRAAQLDRWRVIGKTGTAKLAPGVPEYRGAFAGLFPGDDPRFVLYVMIDRPGGAAYYGGLVAAPMVRSMLVQALALPDSPLDPGRVEQAAPSVVLAGPQLNSLPVKRVPLPAADSVRGPATTAVPELAGRRVRDGIHAAHQAGLRVKLVGSGRIVRTSPEAGDSLPRGSTITVYAEGTR